ncbi:AbrB/MazE/SpoVT family DNA-binding domain-containing protein [Lentilactobacillus sp. IMAU92037]|uniref:AbrB/MazE/SpoVT family DNA-binding domain-containing protein n=1 Tax=Lentilactobacillus TaxID=2767893 RepID=UPI001C261186|nr:MULTISPECIES: AbrB/MazE/SpoVT family DNA-binding domain-containing protein [Lentilactobacillus]MBU9788120.1 AbrB/MazE/SpoVT family DNA-binding domain-containing protein [Lentilactobacillus dabitei]MBV0931258.1 AbrB/MazE/SpoVT family DNA-binding domain-containing protein [Lentilactobacillus dabitei]MDM7515170.1 AbrB/MazE/SpoVT family DNA-binding domain-containing protein [Lentilactobacillus sp. TOM.63]
METVKKIIKVGNSNAVVIPADMLNKLHLSTGDDIVINEQDDSIKITKSKLSESFQDALAEALDKYHGALEDLRKGDDQ